MIKRLLLILIPLCFFFGTIVSVNADTKIEPSEAFYNIAEHKEKVAEIIDMSLPELESLCKEKHIEYIAVNSNNSKQIRITSTTTDFSNSVVNISLLSNDKILALIPQITDINGVTGEIINKGNQKFIKTEFRSKDSGGEYILTQYFTVSDKKSITLSFYTDLNENSDYIQKTFESYENDSFLKEAEDKKGFLDYFLPIGTVTFAAVFVLVAITVIWDFIKKKKCTQAEEDQE